MVLVPSTSRTSGCLGFRESHRELATITEDKAMDARGHPRYAVSVSPGDTLGQDPSRKDSN